MGKVDIEGAWRKLDKLTREEVLMAIVQLMKINHGVDDKVKDVSKGGKGRCYVDLIFFALFLLLMFSL